MKGVMLLRKSWKRKECRDCKSYNPECRMGACSIYSYQKKTLVVKEKEVQDTS
jgi:hypothetical protein